MLISLPFFVCRRSAFWLCLQAVRPKDPSRKEVNELFDGVIVVCARGRAGVSFDSLSVPGVFYFGCSGGQFVTVLAQEVGFFVELMLPF